MQLYSSVLHSKLSLTAIRCRPPDRRDACTYGHICTMQKGRESWWDGPCRSLGHTGRQGPRRIWGFRPQPPSAPPSAIEHVCRRQLKNPKSSWHRPGTIRECLGTKSKQPRGVGLAGPDVRIKAPTENWPSLRSVRRKGSWLTFSYQTMRRQHANVPGLHKFPICSAGHRWPSRQQRDGAERHLLNDTTDRRLRRIDHARHGPTVDLP